ncbi:unnamed protein product [Wickerhamomyces anomalus]
MVKSVNLAIIALKSQISYNVILIARSAGSLISKDYSPIDITNWEATVEKATDSNLSTEALLDFLKKSPLPAILVDNTSNGEIAASYSQLVKNGVSVATPNKKGFSSDLASWKELFNNAQGENAGLVYHEATVGAGLPIIAEPKDVKFSEIVKVAKELGYTEPDPRDDLNGLDVARKVTIVARLSGSEVESPTSFPVQSLIPKDLESVKSAAEFLEKLPNYDHELQSLKDEAAKENKVLRFVGKVDIPNKIVSVGVEKYDYSHPFAALKGSDNVISIKTKRYQNPLIVQGAGAGADVTAAGVLADTIKIAQRIAK